MPMEDLEVNESILNSIKKLLGIAPDYTQFDADLIMHINSVFMVLNQLGVGPPSPFSIQSSTNLWSEFMANEGTSELVKSYMFLKVKLLFDPPQNGTLVQAMKDQIAEFEWRSNVFTGK